MTLVSGGKTGSAKALDRPARIVVANDVELIVAGLRALLAPYQDRVEVVGTATGDPEILLEAVTTPEADVLLIDAFSRSGAGLDAARAVLATTRRSRSRCSPRPTTSATCSQPSGSA